MCFAAHTCSAWTCRSAASFLVLINNASRIAFLFAERKAGGVMGCPEGPKVSALADAADSVEDPQDAEERASALQASRSRLIAVRDKPGGDPMAFARATFQLPAPTGVLGTVPNCELLKRHGLEERSETGEGFLS